MSKTTIVGGKMTIRVGGKLTLNAVGGDITFTTNGHQIWTAGEGHFLGEYEEIPFPEYPWQENEKIALASVEFRPKEDNSYDGEFGFDWLRIAEGDYTLEPAYESILESGFEAPEGQDTNSEYEAAEKVKAFKALESMYKQLPVNREPTVPPFKYYVPWLNLYPKEVSMNTPVGAKMPILPFEATLRMLVDIQGKDEPDQLRVDFNKEYFEINGKDGSDANSVLISDKKLGTKREAGETLKITCLKEFSRYQEIIVYAYPKGSLQTPTIKQKETRIVAGKIIVCANDSYRRKNKKVVLVKVTTNINNSRKSTTGDFTPLEKANLSKALHQALIHPIIEEAVLDLSTDPKFKRNQDPHDYVSTGGKYIDRETGLIISDKTDDRRFPRQGLFTYLADTFHAQTNNQYCDCFVVFAFNEREYTPSPNELTGRVQAIGIENVVLFNKRNTKTLAHECLHGMGLFHTHKDDRITNKAQKFVFPNGNDCPDEATDNYMSYSKELRKTLWHWQWRILNP